VDKIDLVRVMGSVEVTEADPHLDPRKPDHNVQSVTKDRLQTFHSAVLAADTSITIIGPNALTWLPERFVIVVRLSAGSLNIHMGSGRKADYFRLDKGTLVLPMPLEAITIETNGATGFYDIYALTGHKEFSVIS
jgi:hypothetical protein